ncbi:MAG: phosphate ABC transporter ATP-binding protein [Actinobacteria bacterium]|nr:phosphate ABC transporter ATP-binding protein [Actinomycetota bacterium]
MATHALFAFAAVDVVLDGTPVLEDVTIEIPGKGVTAVIGPSGAGKSTLLRLCNRLEVPTTGRITHQGHDLDALDPLALRRRIGMVFQKPTLFGGTVADNLDIAAPASTRDQRLQALQRAALDERYLDRLADTLSGGEAQRVCLARTLLTDPQALLLDEPTSALDAAPKRAFEQTATALAADGIPIVWVTHELDQVRRVADRVLVLDRGRLITRLDHAAQLDERADLQRLLEGADDAQR